MEKVICRLSNPIVSHYRPPFDMSFLTRKLNSSQTSSKQSFIDMGEHKIHDPFKFSYVYVQEESDFNYLNGVKSAELLCRESGRDSEKGFEIVMLNNQNDPTQIFVSSVLYLRDIKCCSREQMKVCKRHVQNGEDCECS